MEDKINMDALDFSFFSSDKAQIVSNEENSSGKSKKSSRSKQIILDTSADDVVLVNPIPGASIAETDYAKSYKETNNLLRTAIAQTDELSNEIKSDIEDVRSSKTIKNKYTYLTNLTASASTLLSTKIAAIKEMNSTITQTHNLELNRMKALKLDKEETNDDMKMMDIYSAFINTPIGSYTPQTPSIQDITAGVPNSGAVTPIEMISANNGNSNGLTPEQNRMRMESNPNIQVVVRYNQMTGNRYFDVIDKTTGGSVPNYPIPDSFLLEDTVIDVHSGIARNRNINTVWPLVVEGDGPINEY